MKEYPKMVYRTADDFTIVDDADQEKEKLSDGYGLYGHWDEELKEGKKGKKGKKDQTEDLEENPLI